MRAERASVELDTSRLRLRPAGEPDVDALHDLWIDRDVRRYLWDDRMISRAEALAVVQQSQETFERTGFGLWTIRPREEERLLGFCGLREIAATSEIEIVYGLSPRDWGRGFATEAAAAVLRFAREHCGRADVLAKMDAPNLASARVAERLGMIRLPGAGPGLVYASTGTCG